MTKWSNEQLQAMKLRQRELLVSAAAGSGKTSVLVERIVQMVTDSENPIDVDRLLIVTFTNAAASEMRTRLYKRLLKEAEAQPENKHIRKQLTLIGQAHVQTIDSFCSYVLRNYFHVINLDPAFRIGDEGELELLKNDTLEALLEEKYQKAEASFLEMTEYFATTKSDEQLENLVKAIYEFSQSSPEPEKWLAACLEPYCVEDETTFNEAPWNRAYLKDFRNLVSEIKADAEKMSEIINAPDGPLFMQAVLDDDLELMTDLETAETYQDVYDRAQRGWKRLTKSRKADFSEELYQRAKELRDTYKSEINGLTAGFSLPVEEVLEDLKAARPAVRELLQFVTEFSSSFAEEKKKRGIISFSDGEHLALQILEKDGEPTDVAKALSEEFSEILIDEYQDSNYLQERILRAVSKERDGHRSIFMVGDMKQSIYRFRMARPELFVDKYDRFSEATDEPDEIGQKIELNANYRSRSSVTQATNYIFGKLMHKSVGNIEYTEKEALHPMGEFKETSLPTAGKAELLLFAEGAIEEPGTVPAENAEDGAKEEAQNTSEEESAVEELGRFEKEAEMIAAEIKKLVSPTDGIFVADKDAPGGTAESGTEVPAGYRHATYRDIVILLRSLSGGAGEAFADVLTSNGIPCYVNRKTGFYDTFEIRNALNILKVIDNPVDDISLAAVMHSPLFGFSSTEMSEIRTGIGNVSVSNGFYGCLRRFLRQEDAPTALCEKIRSFLSTIESLRELSRDLSLSALLRRVYSDTGLLRFAAAMTGGERRVANLNQLIVKAGDYEKLSYTGVFNFIRYVERKRELSSDEGEMSTVNENDNIVRIMTIHTSKGLEYPIVFVSGLGKKMNLTDSQGTFNLHADLGIGVSAIRLDERTERDTYYNQIVKASSLREALGEELRVLYVAMTRAKEKLYLTGTAKAARLDLEGLRRLREALSDGANQAPDLGLPTSEIVPGYSVLSNHSYLAWVLSALSVDAPLNMRIVTEKDIQISEQNQEEVATRTAEALRIALTQEISEETKNRVQELLSFNPHIDDLQDIPATLSVSALKAAALQAQEDPAEESNCQTEVLFIDNKDLITEKTEAEMYYTKFGQTKLTGASRGTLYHTFMERMNPHETAEEALARFEEGGLTSDIEKSTIETAKVDSFWASDLGKRFQMAYDGGKGYRERQFIIALPVKEVLPEKNVLSSNETIMIQGVIDMYFEEEDGIVLVDYKTDRVSNEDILRSRYTVQLEYYEKALEMITGKPVKEKWIYSFALNKEMKL